jgi:hypothetical protein
MRLTKLQAWLGFNKLQASVLHVRSNLGQNQRPSVLTVQRLEFTCFVCVP